MKVLSIGLGIFILTCSAWAEKFLETFDDKDIIEQWQELTILNFGDGLPGPHSWKIVDGQLQSLIMGDERVTHLFVIGDEEWQDYDIEVDVKPAPKTWACPYCDCLADSSEPRKSDMGESSVQLGTRRYPNPNPWPSVLVVACWMEMVFCILEGNLIVP